MAKKPVVKRGKGRGVDQPITAYPEKRTVRISEADNGFTVCMYGPKGEHSFVAKSEQEAMRHAKALLGSKK